MKPEKLIIRNNKNEKLVGELYKNNSQSLIIVCHGLENINNYPDEELQNVFDGYFVSLSNTARASIFSFDFRGYGESDGRKSISLIKRGEDIQTVIDYFSPLYDDIILYGYSFGAMSVVLEAAQDARIKEAILINGVFSFAPRLLNLTQLRNILLYTIFHPQFILDIFYWKKQFHIEKITIPTLIICAEDDPIVGSLQSKYLYKKLHTLKKLVLFPTNDHMLRNEVGTLPKVVGNWVREQNK